jgi:histidinol-phosphate aminotransferase
MEDMKQENVLVGRPFPPMFDWCRISTGTMDEMKIFTDALGKVMGL